MLLVHGTFSSTRGSFGALAATPWGRSFVADALDAYDVVLGYDHVTLSEDPLDNAEELHPLLHDCLRGRSAKIDVVSYSRGALVGRSLVEHIHPRSNWDAQFTRVVMVGGTSGGTALADEANWHTMIDLYTNVTVAGARLVALFAPPAGVVSSVLTEGLRGLAVFAKALASSATDSSRAPGLAAMTPDGSFVAELNGIQQGQPMGATEFYAVTSNFETDGLSGADELPAKLKRALADRLVDQLMGTENDLVVDVPSMTEVDPQIEGLVIDTLDFGTNGEVYHTNYFSQASTVAALRDWLKLAPRRRAAPDEPDVPEDLPSVVSLDPVVLDSSMLVGDIAAAVDHSDSEFVVVRRFDDGTRDLYHYAFTRPELREFIQELNPDWSLDRPELLHEYQSSDRVALGEVTGPSDRPVDTPWGGRLVVEHGRSIVGVVPHRRDTELRDTAAGTASRADRAPRRRRGRGAAVDTHEPEIRRPDPAPRRGLRRGAAPDAPPPGSREGDQLKQQVRAEMDSELPAGRRTELLVSIGPEELARSESGRVAGAGEIYVDPMRQLTVTVIPRSGLRVVDEARAELVPVVEGAPADLIFDIEALEVGPAEIWVIVRQNAQALVTLKLHTQVVASDVQPDGRRSAAEGKAVRPDTVPPRHELSIFEVPDAGDTIRYMFQLDNRALGHVLGYSEAIPRDQRERFVENIYREIEGRWLQHGDDIQEFERELRAYGALLFRELMPTELRDALWERRTSIDSIEVVSTEPFIPWELVHLTPPSGRVPSGEDLFLGSLGMVRWLHNVGAAPAELRLRQHRAFAVVPDYPPESHMGLPATSDELRFLEETYEVTRVDAQQGPIIDLISQPGAFDLLHFAGHGEAEHDDIANSKLVLEGRMVDGAWTPTYLSSTLVDSYAQLEQEDGSRPIVVLNACQIGRTGYQLTSLGGFSQAFLNRGAGMFVGSLWSVGDDPASVFIENLYAALNRHRTLATAVGEARSAARSAGDATWLAYAVYGDAYATLTRS